MPRSELRKLAEDLYDLNINKDPNTMLNAVLSIRSALLRVVRHLEQKE